MTKSNFFLQHTDGTYHALKRDYSGVNYIVRVSEIEKAMRFDGYEFAVSHKNNESHLRHLPMKIVELRYQIEVVDRGDVPVTTPNWEDFDEVFDAQEFARLQGDRAMAAGRRAEKARHR